MPLIRGDEKIALRAVAGGMAHGVVERAEERDRVERHADVHGGGKLRPYAAHALAGRSFSLLALALQHHDVPAAGLRQVVRHARAHDPAADDDYIRRLHLFNVVESEAKERQSGLLQITRRYFPGNGSQPREKMSVKVSQR